MENIKVTVEESSGVTRKLRIEVPAEEIDRVFGETYREYRKQAVLPGFRRGKVPMDVIENRFREDVTNDVTRSIFPESYEQALKQEGLQPISEPKVEEFSVEEGKPLTYTAEFEVLPEFELGEYLGIEIESPPVEVLDEEINSVIDDMRASGATVSKVTEERGIRDGDVAMIDFEGKAEGKPVPGGSAKDFPLTIGSNTFLPGFEDALIGAPVGEEREFFLKLPDQFQEEDLAGKEASFKVKVREIRERVLPELDDEFAKDAGDFKSLQELMDRLRANILATKELSSQGDLKEKLIGSLVDAHPFEAPSAMVQHRRATMMANVERNLIMRGVSKDEVEKSREKIYEDAAEPAERRVRATLILEAIAEKEKIEVSEEEIQAEIKRIAEQNKIEPGEARRKMIENNSLESLSDVIREDKTVSFLLEKAVVTGGAGSSAPAAEKGKDTK